MIYFNFRKWLNVIRFFNCLHTVKTFSTGFCFLSGCGLIMQIWGAAALSILLPLGTDHCWGKLKQVKLSGTALKPIKIQCWRTIGKPIIWEHDPLALMKKIWSATIADCRFMQFIAKIFDYSIIIHMQLYSITLALHEQWAKSKEPGVMSRLMECHFYVVNNDILPIYEPQFPCSFCTFSLFEKSFRCNI